jgi:hypothetical protein
MSLSVCRGRVYGLNIQATGLPSYIYKPKIFSAHNDVEFTIGNNSYFRKLKKNYGIKSDANYYYRVTSDGASVYSWPQNLDAHIDSSGEKVLLNEVTKNSRVKFNYFYFNQILSTVLAHKNIESLHGSAMIFNNKAIGILGASGAGKSSLSAYLMTQGFLSHADDLIAIDLKDDAFVAYKGPDIIRLFDDSYNMYANQLNVRRLSTRLSANKWVYKIVNSSEKDFYNLSALFILKPENKSKNVVMRRLSGADAFQAVLQNIYNFNMTHPSRMQNQINTMASLIQKVPVYSVNYPRKEESMPILLNKIKSRIGL